MARQKGLLTITGTLEGVNFYVSKGIGYARKAGGGFNGDAIKTKENMQRVRANGSEFGQCSRIKKRFRLALLPFLRDLIGKEFHSKMMQLFLELKTLDLISEHGKRNVSQGLQTTEGKRLLDQFEFTAQHSVFNDLYEHMSFDWTSQTLRVSNFDPKGFKSPKAATHLGVTLGVLDFDFMPNVTNPESSLQRSPTHFIEKDIGKVSFELNPETVKPIAQVGVAMLSLGYYQLIGGKMHELEHARSVRIIGSFYSQL